MTPGVYSVCSAVLLRYYTCVNPFQIHLNVLCNFAVQLRYYTCLQCTLTFSLIVLVTLHCSRCTGTSLFTICVPDIP
jgi:hypothetical protein